MMLVTIICYRAYTAMSNCIVAVRHHAAACRSVTSHVHFTDSTPRCVCTGSVPPVITVNSVQVHARLTAFIRLSRLPFGVTDGSHYVESVCRHIPHESGRTGSTISSRPEILASS